jgi:NAD(P)-dependent dehydrogenase (short-subunit alcohol dehydrogenase family)
MSTKQQQPKAPYPPQTQPKPGLDAEMEPKPKFQAPLYKGADKLKGKVALITGGDSGIGKSVAVLYAREGADVAIVYLPAEQSDAEETKRYVEKEGRKCLLLPGDVTDPKFCHDAVETTVAEYGHLDILVNNAAFQERQERIEDITDEQLDKTFKTNIYAFFYLTRAALAYLPKGGVIVNCGSITGLEGNKTLIDYASTKGAIHAFTKSLAQSLIERKIRVNCVSPGPVWTPFIPSSGTAEKTAEHGSGNPLGRAAQPEEIAPAFVFFASEADSSFVTGEILTLLGGEVRVG